MFAVVILATPQALQNQANRATVESLVKRYNALLQEKKVKTSSNYI